MNNTTGDSMSGINFMTVANSDLSVKEFCLAWKAKLAKGEAA